MDPQDRQALAERIGLLLQPMLDCRVDVPRLLRDALYARDVLLVCEAHRGTELATLAGQYREALADGTAGRSRVDGADTPRRAQTRTADGRRNTARGGRPGQASAYGAVPADAAARPQPPASEHPGAQASTRAGTDPGASARGDSTIARAMRQQEAQATPPPRTKAARVARAGQAVMSASTGSATPAALDSGLSSFFDRFRASAPATLPPVPSSTRPLTLGLDGPDTWPPEADSPLDDALGAPSARPPGPRPRGKDRGRRPWFSPSRWFSRGPV